MARSHYKDVWQGKLPGCALCAGPGEGAREELLLTHGVRVWLCAAHRSPAFLTMRAGRDLVASLHEVWRRAGALSTRRSQALDAHLARVRAAARARGRPGSWAWPTLRAEAEARFARGETPAALARELRARHRDGVARPPALRTIQRWYAEGRWLQPPGSGQTAPDKDPPSSPAPAPQPAERPTGTPPPAGGRWSNGADGTSTQRGCCPDSRSHRVGTSPPAASSGRRTRPRPRRQRKGRDCHVGLDPPRSRELL